MKEKWNPKVTETWEGEDEGGRKRGRDEAAASTALLHREAGIVDKFLAFREDGGHREG